MKKTMSEIRRAAMNIGLPVPTEHDEQAMLIRMVEAAYPASISKMLYAIPNGGDRNVLVAMKLKQEGVRRGIPDLFLAVPCGNYHGLYVEMKRRSGGRVSPEQKEYIDALADRGYRAVVCCGCDEAIQAITEYLGAERIVD